VELRQLNKCCDELEETLQDIAQPNSSSKELSSSTSTFLEIMSQVRFCRSLAVRIDEWMSLTVIRILKIG